MCSSELDTLIFMGFYVLVMESKVCKACGEVKELENYHKSKENRDGRCGKCKVCVKNKVPIPLKNINLVAEGLKECSSCKEILDINNFVKDKHRPDDLAGNCKICRKKNSENAKSTVKIVPNYKKCSSCKIEKSKDEFSKNETKSSGLDSSCKSCYQENYYKRLNNKVYNQVVHKTCTTCNCKKLVTDFHKSVSSNDNYRNICSECAKILSKQHYIDNREDVIEYEKKRRESDPERSRAINKKSYYNNKESRAKSSKKYRDINKKEISARNKKWREANKEILRAKSKDYVRANPHIGANYIKRKKRKRPLF